MNRNETKSFSNIVSSRSNVGGYSCDVIHGLDFDKGYSEWIKRFEVHARFLGML